MLGFIRSKSGFNPTYLAFVGWAERSEAQHFGFTPALGFIAFSPTYKSRLDFSVIRQATRQLLPNNAFAFAITLSTVKPYFSSTSSPGAEAP